MACILLAKIINVKFREEKKIGLISHPNSHKDKVYG